jgi:hypothetical protein
MTAEPRWIEWAKRLQAIAQNGLSYPFHVYKRFFQCDLLGGRATPSNETDEVLFLAENEIPADLSVARVNARQITRLFEFSRHPEWPADFD